MSAAFSLVLSDKTSTLQVVDAKEVMVEVSYPLSAKHERTIEGGDVEFVIL